MQLAMAMKRFAIFPIAVVSFVCLAGCGREGSRLSQTRFWNSDTNGQNEGRPASGGSPAAVARIGKSGLTIIETPDEAVLARQAEVLNRIDQLSNEEANTVCLNLELIPREQILDRSVQPKNVLRGYTKQAKALDVLEEIEKAINDPRKHKRAPEN